MSMSQPFSIKKGSTLPKITGTFTDADGEALDLSGATVVFRMKNIDTGELKVNDGGALIDDATGGKVSYKFLTTDTDTVGRYYCEWEITQSGDVEVLPTRSYEVVYVEDVLG